jgi:hypothetical protein
MKKGNGICKHAARLIVVVVSWIVTATLRPEVGRCSIIIISPVLGAQRPRPRGPLHLRGGGRVDTDGMPDLIGLKSRQSQYQASRDMIGRMLDAYEPLCKFNPPPANSSNSSQHMFRARLRGDWRGRPLSFGGGEQMVTRAGAARRYNFWTSAKLPWTQWTEYEFNQDGDLVKAVNLTQRKEWDERYGIGGHPGWLGWGGLTLRQYAAWLRQKDAPTMMDQLAARERLERDNLGWPLILADPFEELDALNPPPTMTSNPLHLSARTGNLGQGSRETTRMEGEHETQHGEAEHPAGLEGHIQEQLHNLASLNWLKGPKPGSTAASRAREAGEGRGWMESGEGGQSRAREPPSRSAWRADEDELLVTLHRELGNEWKRIAELLPGKSQVYLLY